MKVIDFVFNGQRIGDTDLSPYDTNAKFTEWRKAVRKAYVKAYSEDMWFEPDIYEEYDEYCQEQRDWLRHQTEVRQMNTPEQNLDFITTVNVDEYYHVDQKLADKLNSMTARELINNLDIFTHASQMVAYDGSIYSKLGDEYCEEHNIDTMYDFFGTKWAEKFFAKRNLLINATLIAEWQQQIDEAQGHINSLLAQNENHRKTLG